MLPHFGGVCGSWGCGAGLAGLALFFRFSNHQRIPTMQSVTVKPTEMSMMVVMEAAYPRARYRLISEGHRSIPV